MEGALVGSTIVVGGLVALVGAYCGALADRFSYWFHVSRGMLWRRHCLRCFSFQAWLTYLPIFGFIWHRGLCSACQQPLPLMPQLAELIGAGALVFAWLRVFGGTLPRGVWGLLAFALLAVVVWGAIVVAISDLVYDEVPLLPYCITIVALLAKVLFFDGVAALGATALGGLIALVMMGALVFISQRRWVHTHDVLFGVLVAMIVGWPGFFITLAFAYLFAVAAGLVSLGWNKPVWKGASSFGIYLFVALLAQGVFSVLAAASRL